MVTELRAVWTQDDFDEMGWHDVSIHALQLEPAPEFGGSLVLDIDYIVEWVEPGPDGFFSFRVCPSTLTFHDVVRVIGDLNLVYMGMDLQLDGVSRQQAKDTYSDWTDWELEGHQFTLTVTAKGFTQVLRSKPITVKHQRLGEDERGGVSFSLTPFDGASHPT